MSSWSGLLREAVARLYVAELELFEFNTAQAEAAEAASEGGPKVRPPIWGVPRPRPIPS